MRQYAKHIFSLAKEIQTGVPKRGRPPDEGFPAESEQVLPYSIVRGTRGYIEKVTNQINGCFENGWFDACAVMMRRLVETLIIEVFEAHNIAIKIKNANDDFLYLRDLIDRTLAEKTWNLSRNAKKALSRLKDLGDRSAHSRRFNAHYGDVHKVLDDFRIIVQELVYLAKLK